ncbi:hypothetical protein HYS00_03400 [Candidatus Microgenomates bacterium]|nr:hypothetical protein [Candidatus Microgenomates bacterium]
MKKAIKFLQQKQRDAVKLLSPIEKRVRFVITTVVLSMLLLTATFSYYDKAWIFIPVLFVATYVLTFFSVLEGIERAEWLTLFLMTIGLSIVFYMFYYLIPVRWLTRVPFIAMYAISIYAVLLTSNIFNVGVEKSIRLYKAAFSVNYFYHTVLSFIAFSILFTLRENALFNSAAAAIIIFPLAVQLLWTIKLQNSFEKDILIYAAFIATIVGETALVVSFVPFKPSIAALLLTSVYYVLAGLTTAHVDGRLFKNTIREYIIVLAFVLIVALLTLIGW